MRSLCGCAAAFAAAALMIACGGSPAQPETQTQPPAATSGGNNNNNNNNNTPSSTWDLATKGVPPLGTSDYIDLAMIGQISKFRSSEGHSYSDDFESCRSMKHYFFWPAALNPVANTIRIFAPAAGTITRMEQEQSVGIQVRMTPTAYPQFEIIIFHVNPSGISVGSTVTSGQQIGTHFTNMTNSDIAIRVNTPTGAALVSWFDAMSDSVFERYRQRGVAARSDVIISKAQRDADALTCSGEGFVTRGSIDSWFRLQ
jgi:hypothetical protein